MTEEQLTNGSWDSCKMYVLRELQRMNTLHEKTNTQIENLSGKLGEQNRLMTEKWEERAKELGNKIDDLETLRDISKGKASTGAFVFTAVLAVGGLILGILNVLK